MGILEPKDYQLGVLDTLKQMRKDGAHSALIALATGLGKTYTAAFDVEEYMSHSKGRLLLLCHNNDILDQNMAVFKEVLKDKFSYGLFNGIEKVPDADFVFATFQSMKNHKKEFAKDAFSYILVDEAHHAPAETFRTVIDYFQPDFLLGMTATPERADGLELESIFGPITYNLEVGEAIKSGLLVDIDYHLVLDEMAELDSLNVDGEKIPMGELNRRLFIPKRDEEIAKIIKKRLAECSSSSTLVFCCSIEHAENISSLLEGSEVVHSKMSPERNKAILDRFRNGDLPIIVSVDQLNEGIDIPHADVIVFLRSTASKVVFFQQLGRGLRLHEGKDYATILDFVGNYDRLEMLATMQRELNDNPGLRKKHLFLNIEASQFVDRQVNIFDLLDAIGKLTEGWTRESALETLKSWVKENGRMFTQKDLGTASGLPSASTIRKLFGSIPNAQLAVDPEYDSSWTKESALETLKSWVKENGRMFTQKDLGTANGLPSASTIKKLFGSILNAQLAVDPEYEPQYCGMVNWSMESVLVILTKWVKENGRMFTQKDLGTASGLPSAPTIKKLFGSIPNAQLAVDPEYEPSWTKESALETLKSWVKENGRMFTQKDLGTANGLPSYPTIKKLFGSIPNAQLAVDPEYDSSWTKESALETLKSWVKENGRMFTQKDLGTANGLPSAPTIKKLFGSIPNAQLAVDPEYDSSWTKESALETLKSWVKENGRMFISKDLGTASGLPSHPTIKKLFGSIPNAQSAIKSNLSF